VLTCGIIWPDHKTVPMVPRTEGERCYSILSDLGSKRARTVLCAVVRPHVKCDRDGRKAVSNGQIVRESVR
jgi:hypothetical protein